MLKMLEDSLNKHYLRSEDFNASLTSFTGLALRAGAIITELMKDKQGALLVKAAEQKIVAAIEEQKKLADQAQAMYNQLINAGVEVDKNINYDELTNLYKATFEPKEVEVVIEPETIEEV